MNFKILSMVLLTCEDSRKEIEETNEWRRMLKEEEFSPTSEIILKALNNSLTELLCQKVSIEAYQRYSVRTQIIGVVREWSQGISSLVPLRTFQDGGKTLKFVNIVLEKYLDKDILDAATSPRTLLLLARTIHCLIPKLPNLGAYFEKVVNRLIALEPTEEGDHFLCSIVNENQYFKSSSSTNEKIYISQRIKLIETPLLETFISICSKSYTSNKHQVLVDAVRSLDKLAQIMTKFPLLFQIACSYMKEILEQLKFKDLVLHIIQCVIELVRSHCKISYKNILDLYPKSLQTYVILLQIEPEKHSINSRRYTLHELKKIFLKNSNDVMILLSHYPSWLRHVTEHLRQHELIQ
ncbi:uncharacterized protein LOC105703726 [Orussus abietinus]|uniref:uncharacterized protein LOC105703726 n=1 Tax=Orussus abietinus TaxID=222816 RepID=UPI00062540EA|nr:uncharacterized protein LOC105703726 [Orussus abietinus]